MGWGVEGLAVEDVEAGAAQELVDDGLGEAGGIVLDADSLFGFVERDAADAVDLAQTGDGEDGLLGGQDAEVVDHVDCCHMGILAAVVGGEAKRSFASANDAHLSYAKIGHIIL